MNEYGFRGDIYQAGIALYQLLGGYLPYDPKVWLCASELAHYDSLPSEADRSIYADQCIHIIIKKGKVVDLSTLPPWVCKSLRNVIRKACHLKKESRFESAAHFLAKLNEIRADVPDWQIIDGCPTLIASTSYRVISNLTNHQVQKHRGAASWRNDSSISGPTLAEVIEAINTKS
jgi:eukaryotic-like serine/threonine-protein kinase